MSLSCLFTLTYSGKEICIWQLSYPQTALPLGSRLCPLVFLFTPDIYSVTRVSYDLYTHYVFPNPLLGSGGKGVFSKVLLWFNNILTDEQVFCI